MRWSLVQPGQGELAFEKLPTPPTPADGSSKEPAPEHGTQEMFQLLDKARDEEAHGDVTAAVASLREAFARIHSASDFGEPTMNHINWAREHLPPAELESLLGVLRKSMPEEDFESQVQDSLLLANNHSIGEKMLWYDLARMNELSRAVSARLLLVAYPGGFARETMAAFAMVHRLPFVDTAQFAARTVLERSLMSVEERYARQGRLSGHGNEEFARYVVASARRQGLLAP